MIDPELTYRDHLAARRTSAQTEQQRLDQIGRQRLVVFLLGIVVAWLAWEREMISPWWLLMPLSAFVILLVRHEEASRRLLRFRRSIRFYERGLERLNGEWVGHGPTGERFLKIPHLAAVDLDLFGAGSLFERLCTARTRPGEETLAQWLLDPAEVAVIRERQEAIAELRPRLDLREQIAIMGAELPPIDLQRLVEWGKTPAMPFPSWIRPSLAVLSLLNVLTLAFALVYSGILLLFLFSAGLSCVLILRVSRQVDQVLAPVESAGRDLSLLSGLLQVIEIEPFASKRLRELQSVMKQDGEPPSRQIAELLRRVDWLNARRNQFFAPIALLLIWKTRMALGFEAWRIRSGPHIPHWVQAIGEMEAIGSIAAYAYENPADPFPEVSDIDQGWEAEGLGHPLLPLASCVRNDVHLLPPERLLLVSGSNMSGKSTLLRTVGTNTVLALAGSPVRAKRMRLCPVRIGATLRVQDSLLAGKSRFFAEITRVREILDATRGPLPVLFLLDEIFHGTNSHDRVVGAEALIRRLLDAGAMGLVTTHDLSLTAAAERLGDRARNVHFADQFRDGEMVFDYQMRPGVVPHSNALALMRAIGLEV